MYISFEYLQTLHYYFFFMGIVSFFVAFLSPLTSIYLIFFCITHSAYSWLLTWYMHIKIKKLIVINSFKYMLTHVAITVLASAFMFFLYSIFLLETLAFTVSIIQLNFYVFFIATCWFVIVKLNMIKRIFNVKEEIRIEYSEPVSEGSDMKIITKKISMLKKSEGLKHKRPSGKREAGPDLKRDYQIEIYKSQMERLSKELKKTKNKKKAAFLRRRIEEYERKIRGLGG